MSGNETALVKLSPHDNVVVALTAVEHGSIHLIADDELRVIASVGMGQKIACQTILTGELILKYGLPIGVATADIAKGQHVHLHNIQSNYTPTHSLSETSASHQGDE